jgi:hypothetical protein
VALSDGQFRAGAIAGGILMGLGIAALRFCGNVPLPPKPAVAAAPAPERASSDLRSASAISPTLYLDFLARDAAAAGLAAPALEAMSRVLPYRVDAERRVLAVGRRPIEVAGVKLSAVRAGDAIAIEVRNETASDLAYRVVAETADAEPCEPAPPLPFNAMVIAKQERETRVVCAWREDLAIAVTRVETIEVPPLSAWYLSQVPPVVVGIEAKVARGHRFAGGGDPCTSMQAQAVKAGIEQGEIGWRDLVDFYARHRCQTYQFPVSYRAFTKDGARQLPATEEGG